MPDEPTRFELSEMPDVIVPPDRSTVRLMLSRDAYLDMTVEQASKLGVMLNEAAAQAQQLGQLGE
jgi:hypothetical protein